MRSAAIGTVIYSAIGHPFEVLAGGPWLYRAQPLTSNGTTLVPIGTPVLLGFSDLDKRRLPATAGGLMEKEGNRG